MRFKAAARLFVWFLLTAGIFIAVAVISLPHIVEYELAKRIPQYAGPNRIDFNVDKIGLRQATLSDIRINDQFVVGRVDIHYEVMQWSRIYIRKLMVSGVHMDAAVDADGKFRILGLPESENGSSSKPSLDPAVFEYLPDKIRILDSRIRLNAAGKSIFIPFDILADPDRSEKKVELHARVFPFGEQINLLCSFDMQKGISRLLLEAKAFDLAHINTVMKLIRPAAFQPLFTGSADIKIESEDPSAEWNAGISDIGFLPPIDLQLHKIAAGIVIRNKKIAVTTRMNISHPAVSAIPVQGDILIDPASGQPYQLHMQTLPSPNWQISSGPLSALLNRPEFRFDMAADNTAGKGTLTFSAQSAQAEQDDLSVATARISMAADLKVSQTQKGTMATANSRLEFRHVDITRDDIAAGLPVVSASGRLAYDSGAGPSGSLQLTASGGHAQLDQQDLRISGLRFSIPLSYPADRKSPEGSYRIDRITADGQYHFGIGGTIRQTGEKTIAADGVVDVDMLKKVRPEFSGTIDMSTGFAADIDFNLPQVELTGPDIRKAVSQMPADAAVSLMVGAMGSVHIKDNRVASSLALDLSDGSLTLPELKLSAKGINTRIQFNDLLTPETVPGQLLRVDSIEVDKIKINDANVRFSIEDAQYLLLENVKFKWCNGLVSSEALRLPQKDNLYSLILYCDRLELTELLMQMGVFHAQGSGTLNGRIPIVYDDGLISFDNGFLFSTPGSGGKVSVRNTEKLVAGIPMDSPQFSQLDVAREALKDFDYKWAKLTLNTLDDTLFVNMEMDGKPSKVLPFEYRRDLGAFSRVDASHPGSRFQGIKLDVNLNLPFNDVLKFGNTLKSIFNQ